jgi:hypothetical protein
MPSATSATTLSPLRVGIGGPADKVVAAGGYQIPNLKADNVKVSFDRLDTALLMPIDPKARPALQLEPILLDLNGLGWTVKLQRQRPRLTPSASPSRIISNWESFSRALLGSATIMMGTVRPRSPFPGASLTGTRLSPPHSAM